MSTANNRTYGNEKSLYESRYGKWFKTRILGKTHVFVPSVEGAKTILSNDFVHFNKKYVKSMADSTGEMSVFAVPHEIHTRIRRLLSDPFSMTSLSKFVGQFDRMLCERLDKLEKSGKSFRVIDFSLKVIELIVVFHGW